MPRRWNHHQRILGFGCASLRDISCSGILFFCPASLRFVSLFLLCLLIALPAHAAKIQEVTSAKGITAWLIEDNTVPVVTLRFAFRGGVEQDTPDTQGMSALLADLLTEGAGTRDAKAFQRALASDGISFGLEAGRDAINGSLYAQSSALSAAGALARDALTKPRFDDAAITRLKQNYKGAIKARLADPEWQARRALFATLFEDHPYAYRSLGTAKSITALTASDLRSEHKKRLARDNLLVVAVGDISPKTLGKLLDQIFGTLPAKATLRPISDIAAPTTGRIIEVTQEGGQSLLLFAAPGIKRDDPDWHAASLLNYILGGGGFESRLMHEVRDKRGLTYGIDTSLSAMDHAGLVLGDARTSNAKAGEAWSVTRSVWEKVWQNGVTAAELDAAKKYLIGSLPTGFTSSGAIAGMLLELRKDRLPRTYFDQRAALLSAVTLKDIGRVAQRLLDPERMTLIVVGKPDGIDADDTQEFVDE